MPTESPNSDFTLEKTSPSPDTTALESRQVRRVRCMASPLSAFAADVSGTEYQDDPVRLFEEATRKHGRDLANMKMARGILLSDDMFCPGIAEITACLGNAEYSGSMPYPENTWAPRVRQISRGAAWAFAGYRERVLYPENAAVLFFSHKGEILQAWLINARGVQAYHRQSISKQRISQAIADLRASLDVESLQRSRTPCRKRNVGLAFPVAPAVSHDLAGTHLCQILLPSPIAKELETVKHLIVVPILEIGTVPYAILRPFGDNTVLIDSMSVSVASSLVDVVRPHARSWDLFQSPLIVGNPYLPKSADWVVPPLQGAEQEAQVVAAMMKCVALVGREATKDAVVLRAPRAGLLYFATHGMASSRDPLSGGCLMLSAATLKQGLWTAREIQDEGLRAEIAVLSACQTGLGQSHDAGMIGLSRAFQLAGVSRVVMSLWNVDDQATKDLMQTFVRHLPDTIPAEALRQAMLEVRQEHLHPAQWASFVLFGTPR